MSALVAAALPNFILYRADPFVDEANAGDEYAWPPSVIPFNAHDPPGDDAYFVTPWWPNGGGFVAGGSGGDSPDVGGPASWMNIWPLSGCNGRLGFVGVTRDQYGSPLGGCTVRAFRTATDQLVAKVTSDANGNYIATSPYLEDHYLVIHSSDGQQAGASVSTIDPG